MQNHERFKHWREAMTAFANEVLDTHPESATMPQFILDHWMLEWLYESVKSNGEAK